MKVVKPSGSTLLNLLIIPILICTVVILVISILSSSSSSTTGGAALNNYYGKISSPASEPSPTKLEHIAFGIGSNKKSWAMRKEFVKLWWAPHRMRGCVFLDEKEEEDNDRLFHLQSSSGLLSRVRLRQRVGVPPVCVSEDTSRFRYTYKYKDGLRSAVRIARIVSETVNLNLPDVRWYVFGDDDTVFFPSNLVKTLSKYDHELWYYVGSNSEIYEQNQYFSFDMAFGGAGFAISSSLAKVLAKKHVLDSCIERYPHLYGSDGRISSCLAELGVGLTHEPGFHQMDVRGDIFGILASHPLQPLVSLHHLEHAAPIFPIPDQSHNNNNNNAVLGGLRHLFRAVQADPHRVLQQTVCYVNDPNRTATVSVSWGYAVEVFDCHVPLPDAIRVERTLRPWKMYGPNELSSAYMFSVRKQRNRRTDQCGGSSSSSPRAVFFFDRVSISNDDNGEIIQTVYKKNSTSPLLLNGKIDEVVVFSRKFQLGLKQLRAPRRHCCNVLPLPIASSSNKIEINIRECNQDELTYMHPKQHHYH